MRVLLTKVLFSLDQWAGKMRPALKARIKADSFLYKALRGPSNLLRIQSRNVTKSGIFVREEEMEYCSLFPKKTLDFVISEIKPKTMLDVGCGTGVSLAYFVQSGVDARGLEGSALAIAKAKHPDRIRLHNLEKAIDLGQRFDLVWSFEVAEHLHPRFADEFVDTLTRHGNVVVMSAARPGQGGEGHFNEQEPEYWIEKFRQRGLRLDERLTQKIRTLGESFSANMMVVRK
jgi:SAM-dependent methyltransferase